MSTEWSDQPVGRFEDWSVIMKIEELGAMRATEISRSNRERGCERLLMFCVDFYCSQNERKGKEVKEVDIRK